jgi:ribulose kinase
MPDTWKRAARFFDLPDFLSYRATGVDTRSMCTTVCKWTYQGHESGGAGRWDTSFFEQVGLGDLAEESFQRIGQRVRPIGECVGGLSERAASELGLQPGTPVAVAIIDAHAGGLGLLGTPVDGEAPNEDELDERLALIGGTSSCHMAVSKEPRFIPGIWGPYFAAMVPGFWLTDGVARRPSHCSTNVSMPYQRSALSPHSSRRSSTCCPTSTVTAVPGQTRPCAVWSRV